MRIVFAGTPEFAAQSLSALIKAGHEVICVYTQPDRKTGRGQKLTPPAVKKVALESNIQVEQPLSFKEDSDFNTLQALQADIMIVVAYGMLLPQRVLDLPKFGCLNIHGSLLPRWRGAAPIQRAIEAGDKKTGICIMQMEAGLDTGPILSTSSLDIDPKDTSASLHDKLAVLGAASIIETLEKLPEQLNSKITQNDNQATYAHKITKSEADINWNDDAQSIQNRINAFNPWPFCQGPETIYEQHSELPGTITSINKKGIQVACGDNILNILSIQREGSKAVAVADFINSTSIEVGESFSNLT